MVSNEEKQLKDRIIHLLAHKRYSIARLADTESKRIMLRRQINGDAVVPFSTLYLLLYTFHDISADWLILGDGNMYKAERGSQTIEVENIGDSHNNGDAAVHIGNGSQYAIDRHAIEERDRTITQLTAQIDELKHDKEFLQSMLSAFQSAHKKTNK